MDQHEQPGALSGEETRACTRNHPPDCTDQWGVCGWCDRINLDIGHIDRLNGIADELYAKTTSQQDEINELEQQLAQARELLSRIASKWPYYENDVEDRYCCYCHNLLAAGPHSPNPHDEDCVVKRISDLIDTTPAPTVPVHEGEGEYDRTDAKAIELKPLRIEPTHL